MNIRAERINRGLGCEKAAKEIGIHHLTLARAENGAMPRADKAKLIADYYGVKVTDIWPVEDESPKAAA